VDGAEHERIALRHGSLSADGSGIADTRVDKGVSAQQGVVVACWASDVEIRAIADKGIPSPCLIRCASKCAEEGITVAGGVDGASPNTEEGILWSGSVL